VSVLGGRRRVFVALVMAGALVAGACGGESKSDKSLNVLRDYLVATNSDDIAKVEELVEPDSPLAAYVPMISLYAEALRQYGGDVDSPEVTIENESVVACYPDGECRTSTNPVVSKSGRLEDYTDTAGRTMDQKLLIAQPQKQSVYGGTVNAYPYFSSSGSLTVVVKFEAGPDGLTIALSPQVFFTGSDRVQMAPNSSVRPDIYNLGPGNSQTRAWSFKGAVPPGKFEVEVRAVRSGITLVPFEILAPS